MAYRVSSSTLRTAHRNSVLNKLNENEKGKREEKRRERKRREEGEGEGEREYKIIKFLEKNKEILSRFETGKKLLETILTIE